MPPESRIKNTSYNSDTDVIILQCVVEVQYQPGAVTSHKIPIMVRISCTMWKQRQEDGMFCLSSLNKVGI